MRLHEVVIRGRVVSTWAGGFTLSSGEAQYRVWTGTGSPWGIGAMPPAMVIRRRSHNSRTYQIVEIHGRQEA